MKLSYIVITLMIISFSLAIPNDSGTSIDFSYPEVINYSEVPTVNNSDFLDGYSSDDFWKAYENQTGLIGNKNMTGNFYVNGKLGVGTSTPSGVLEVHNADDFNVDPFRIFNDNGGNVLAVSTSLTGDPTLSMYNYLGGNIFAVNGNGHIGVGHTSPQYPIDFANSEGQKIAFYTGRDDGIGYRDNLVEFNADNTDTDWVWGSGKSGSVTAVMTLLGSGGLGIGKSPTHTLDVLGDVQIQSSANSTTAVQILDDDGGTPIFNVDTTNERVGIGTATPSDRLHILAAASTGNSANAVSQVVIESTSQGGLSFVGDGEDAQYILFGDSDDNIGYLKYDHATDDMTLRANNIADQLVLDSSGRVGIGTNSPDTTLHIHENSAGAISAHAYSTLTVENNDHSMINILTPNNKAGYIGFGDTEDSFVGGFYYHNLNDNMQMYVNNTIAQYWGGNGNVGIGTSSPVGKLHVNGSDSSYISLISGATKGVRIGADSLAGIIQGVDNTGTASYQPLKMGGSIFQFLIGASEKMRVHSDGNVGIGTSSPSRKLTVSDTGNSVLAIVTEDNTSLTQLAFGDPEDDNRMQIVADHNLDKLSFQTGGGASIGGGTDRLVIDSSGNVGIGTTSPGDTLEILPPSAGGITVRESDNGNDAINLGAGTGAGFIILKSGGVGKIYLHANSDSYFNSGKVGIGTSTPEYKLHVVANSGTWGGVIQHQSSDQSGLLVTTASSNSSDFGFAVNNGGGTTFSVRANGNVGIGTTSPSYPLEVSGNSSGITAYFENNVSAEDYLYHSPFPEDSYTDEQALNDLIKINGANGKINHSSLPTNALSILKKPIYEDKITQEEKTKEVCEDILINETLKEYNQECHNETYIENITTQEKIGEIDEPQTSIGMLLGDLIKSVREINKRQQEQESRIDMLEKELCLKDKSYSWCK